MSKDETYTSVVIMTANYRITGNIGLMPGARLTDYITEVSPFFPVKDAKVADRASGEVHFICEFLDVNRDRIEIIVPTTMIRELDVD